MSNPFNVLSSQYSVGSPLENRSAKEEWEIIGNDLSGFTQSLPLVGRGIDIADATIGSTIDTIKELITNPLGVAEMAAQKLKVRKVISWFFEGVDGLLKGKPTTFGQAIVYHKGHGYTYDAKGNASFDTTNTTDKGSFERFPSFGSMPNFFRTTIGTDFYWGIRLSKASTSFANLPEPIFCDPAQKYDAHDGHYFQGWLPAQSYEFSDYITEETEEIQSLAFSFNLPSGYKIGNSISTTLIETDILEVREWLEKYRTFTHPSPKIVLPYKNCIYRLTLYTYQPTGDLIRKYPFYVLPEVTQSLSGENSPSATYPTIKWTIVGKAPSSTDEE